MDQLQSKRARQDYAINRAVELNRALERPESASGRTDGREITRKPEAMPGADIGQHAVHVIEQMAGRGHRQYLLGHLPQPIELRAEMLHLAFRQAGGGIADKSVRGYDESLHIAEAALEFFHIEPV